GEGALLEALPDDEPDFLAAVDAQRAQEADEALTALDDELDMTVPDAEADDLAGPPLADDDLLRDLSADLPVDEDGAVG
ncbi:MAG: hypothetical protein JW910_07030, partial [Anaerolineae bacterium]|nr:hypothetical protein [Anaerolineae bacterium]